MRHERRRRVFAGRSRDRPLGLEVNVTGWSPLAENMPSGSAHRPGDVLTYGGKTVEVLNTDAEGRLVLADALARPRRSRTRSSTWPRSPARWYGPGQPYLRIMSNDDAVGASVHEPRRGRRADVAHAAAGPSCARWMDSTADIANMGDRLGGMLVAGLFLKEFVGDGLPWAHLDIAGPAFNEGEAFGYTPKGGTGAGVRTLVQPARDIADGRLTL